MRPMRRGMIGVVLVATALLAACLPKVEQPQVWLDGARLSSLGLGGGVVDVHLSVYNPNRFALEASGLTYKLQVQEPDSDEWLDFTDGRYNEDLRVAPGDTAEVVVPVEFSYGGLGRVIRSLLDRGTFDYRVSGVVAVETPVQRNIRYRHSGNVTPNGLR